ncbi:MAG: hypothetical protein ACYDCL_08490 [Myxococcales bacterium]
MVIAAGACAAVNETGSPPERPSEDLHWREGWERTAKAATIEAALQRSDLAYEAVALHPGRLWRLGLGTDEVASQGLAALYRALGAAPAREDLWERVAAWRRLLGDRLDATAASRPICLAAEAQGAFESLRLCADLVKQAGRPTDAIARWRSLIPKARGAAERNSLIVRIEHASTNPTADLAGLSPLDIQVADTWEQSRERREVAQRQAARAESGCIAQCVSQHATCLNSEAASEGEASVALGLQSPFLPSCDAARRSCESSCSAGGP